MVGDHKQLDKILAIKDNLPELKAIVLFDGESKVPGVISWKELIKIGQDASDSILKERLRNIAVNQCCVVSYTSGTTGMNQSQVSMEGHMTYD